MSKGVLEDWGLRAVRPEVIDSSMLKDFMDCPSMFYLRHVLGLRKKFRTKQEDAKYDWGTCWHGFEQVLWETEDLIQALQFIDQNFPASIDPISDRHKRSKERMLRQAMEYHERFFDLHRAEYEILRTEQFFHIRLDSTNFEWAGRMDQIRRRRRGGKIVVWDFKTASVMGPGYFSSHEVGFQIPGYVRVASDLMNDSVDRAALDVMYTLAGSHEFFIRTFSYTPHSLLEWENNVKAIVDQINYLLDHHLYEPEKWVKNWQECHRYGTCQFWDVHSTPPIGTSRLAILSEDYFEDRWDPINDAKGID